MLRRHALTAAVATAAAASLALAPAALAERFVAADDADRLYTFDDKRPGKTTRTKPLRGLSPEDRIVALDVRPANGQLVALTQLNRLYNVNPAAATATMIGSGPFEAGLSGLASGFDFNPMVDRIRLVSNGGQNLRLNPDTGTIAFTDRVLSYKDGDPGAGVAPVLAGSAYTNSVAGSTSTTLYNIDSGRDTLVIQDPPNDGILTTVGALGVNLAGPVSFDISPTTGKAFVLARRARSTAKRLYTINLSTGAARQIAIVTRAPNLSAFAALPRP